MLVAPAVVVLTLVSSQTGFNHHLRYVLPALPFLFVWISRVGRCLWWRNNKVFSLAAAAALVCSMAGSLSVYPHSLSFFNLAAGGPANGSAHLLHSNIDWGQDLLYLKEWLDDHPEAAPIRVACSGAAPIEIVGIDPRRPPKTVAPGWYAVSINILRGEQPHDKPSLTPRDGPYYDYFQHQQPVATAGYSICIYHITREEAKQVRREMGLPEVAE